MNPVILIVRGLLFSGFHILTVHRFMENFFHNPRKIPLRYGAWIAYFCLVSAVHAGVNIPPLLLLLFNLLMVFIVNVLSYYSSLKNRCIFSIFLVTVWMLMEIVVDMILSSFGMGSWEIKSAGTAIVSMCMYLLTVITGHYAKGEDRPDLSVPYVLAIIFIPAGSICLIHYIFSRIVAFHMEYSAFGICSSFILLLMNYTAFEVYERMTKDAGIQERNLLYEQELELISRQTKEREAYDKQIGQLRHDMKNHLTGLLGMLQENDQKQAEEYIRLLLKESTDSRELEVSRSGNPAVDAIINSKYAQARREDIRFEANVFIPSELPFHAAHLTIVFGNILDNALEACREIELGEKWIDLEAAYTKEVLMITVNNSCVERKKDRSGRFFTTKKDRRGHGLGLVSVEQALEPYQGQLEMECEKGIFHSVVVMYGKTEEK